jgi:predicted enzyme related to lactoylglutathione lyase
VRITDFEEIAMPRPVHFEIHASEPVASRAFYEQVFGWRFHRWEGAPYWLVSTGDGNPMTGEPDSEPGIDGGLVERVGPAPAEGQPVNSFVVTVDVPDCAGYVQRALTAGGSVAVPLSAVPGIGWLAYVKDPDGNILGLMQSDPAAALPD